MSILEETAALARERLGDSYFSRQRLERLVVGIFFTGVKLSGGPGGVCFTPVKDIPQAVCCPSSAARTFDPTAAAGLPVEQALTGLTSPEPLKTAVAIAVLGALSAACWERGLTGGFSIQKNVDAKDRVRLGPDAKTAVVGAFVPVLRRLRQRGGTWWVLEQDPRTLRGEELDHYVPADQAGAVVPQADVLIVTGVTLINHTLEVLLKMARPGAEIAVMGPTAGLLPEPMFQRGVRVAGGVWVRRPDELLDVLAAGGSGYHFFDTLADRIVIENDRAG
ncbi:MAG: DUF364 domain-containing protein [Thermodesulfobacteriota bacterium]